MQRNKPRKAGKLIFFIPVAAVILLVLFGLVSYVADESGTLVVEAVSSTRYSAAKLELRVPFSVGTTAGATPYNLSLPIGSYTVTYGAVQWFYTPAPRTVSVAGGKTVYAIAVYDPVQEGVTITQNGFNDTRVGALHAVTPVVWINHTNATVVLVLGSIGNIPIAPSLNYTHVFGSKGTYAFSLTNQAFSGEVISA